MIYFLFSIDNGFDVFAGVPSDDDLKKKYFTSSSVPPNTVMGGATIDGESDAVIEVYFTMDCDKPPLPFYQLSHNSIYIYYKL